VERIAAWTDLVAPPGNFRYGSIVGGQAPTPIKAEWLNMVQGELVNFILAYLPALSAADNSQLLKAARAMVANFATKATTLGGYGITDAYTKTQTDGLLSAKANWGITLAAYGIGDAYTKTAVDTLLNAKAAKATTLGGYGITDAYTKTQTDGLLAAKANWGITLAAYGIGDAYTKTAVDTALLTKQDKNTASLGVNGWHLDSATGRLEVWGQVQLQVATATGAQADAAVVFPIPFPNAAFNVSFSSTGGDLTEIVENIVGFSALTKSGMTVSVKRMSGSQTGAEKTLIHYRVIGN
jgi:phage-related tail fiber protein